MVPNSNAFLSLTPVLLMALRTITEKAIAAIASIVKYPSWKPAVNGAPALKFSPTGFTGFDMYMAMAVPTSNSIEINNKGVRTLPILSAKVPGFQLKANIIMKNITENISNGIAPGESRNGITLISYAVVAVLGIAKNGPIVK